VLHKVKGRANGGIVTEWRKYIDLSSMTKKQTTWIFGFIAIGFFIYQFKAALEFSNRPRPVSVEQNRINFINGCIKYNFTLSILDSITAKSIAACVYEKGVADFGYQKFLDIDARAAKGDTIGLHNLLEPIFDSCEKPYMNEIYRSLSINRVESNFAKKGYKKEVGKAYAECFYSYLVNKYDIRYNHPLTDSIIRSESLQAKKCLEKATGKMSNSIYK
jgi:hypothetical protein